MFGNPCGIGNGGWGNPWGAGAWGNNCGVNPMAATPMSGVLMQERASAQTTPWAVGAAGLGALVACAITHRANPSLPSTLIGAAAGVGAILTGWIAGGFINGMARGNAAEQYLNMAMMNGNGLNMMM